MKTVSLTEALRSGKSFDFKIPRECPGETISGRHEAGTEYSWSQRAILHAECQIIKEPREIWVWEYNNGNLDAYYNQSEISCRDRGKGWGGRPALFREVIE